MSLKSIRREHGLSQTELASLVGVKQNTVCGWEKGTRCPSLKMLRRLAFALDCSIDVLVNADTEVSSDGN